MLIEIFIKYLPRAKAHSKKQLLNISFTMISPTAILSTAYFPPIQFFSKLKQNSTILLEKHETYPKQTYRNRCEIYSANGRMALTIPIVKPKGNRTPIDEVLIDHSDPWAIKHWRAIESAYRRSAYFELLEYEFALFYQEECPSLWAFNQAIIAKAIDIIGLNVEMVETTEFTKTYPNSVSDFRYSITPKLNFAVSDKDFSPAPYFQVFADKFGFIPNLSILDLIFNCGPEGGEYL